ncbi:MAG: YggS family pyridoxal phosphate-dependent enzyme [Deltaproteobacteria bacterium]|nr:YggS family pyridoxal phosphate-dependent enzyme [Deltaproteobacteria bacterium]
MSSDLIREHVRLVLAELPSGVSLVAAGKTRSPDELHAAIEAGVEIVGHNYVQEARASIAALGREAAAWHMIGHLQRNKAREAVELFDLVETLDSLRLARALDKACAQAGRELPVLIEVNSGLEPDKHGAHPDEVEKLARELADFPSLRLEGLMTMGPFLDSPEQMRPYFRLCAELYRHLESLDMPGAALRTLSMGMSDSYRVAIEEGANLVRIGTRLFGPREAK